MISKKSRTDFPIDLQKGTILLVVLCALKVMFFREVPASPYIHIFWGGGLVLWTLFQVPELVRVALRIRVARRVNLVVMREQWREELEPVSLGDFVWHSLLPLGVISAMMGFGLGLVGLGDSLSSFLVSAAYLTLTIGFIRLPLLWVMYYLVNKRIKGLGEESLSLPRHAPSPEVAQPRLAPTSQVMVECDQGLPAKSFKLNYFVIGLFIVPVPVGFASLFIKYILPVINALLRGRTVLPIELGLAIFLIITAIWLSVYIYQLIFPSVRTRFTENGVCVRKRSGYVMLRWADVRRAAYQAGANLVIESKDEKITVNMSIYRHPDEIGCFVKDMLISHNQHQPHSVIGDRKVFVFSVL